MLRAEVTQDQEFFRELELCDFRFVGWHGEQLTKKEDLAAVAEPRAARIEAFGVGELAVRFHGGTGLVWGLDTMVIRGVDGERRVSHSRFIHVYLRQGNRWRLAASHASSLETR